MISGFGVIAWQSTEALRRIVHEHKGVLPEQVRLCADDLLEHIVQLEANIAEYNSILTRTEQQDPQSQQLMELQGIDPTTACALVASIGRRSDFKNGRQRVAWLGLTPSQ